MERTITTIELYPNAPYDFARSLAYLRAWPAAVLEQVDSEGTYRRALTLNGSAALITLGSVGTLESPRLLLQVDGSNIDSSLLASATQTVTRTFLLNEDPHFTSILSARDPVLGAVLQRFEEVRPVLVPDPYEALIGAIVGQQIHTAFARKLKMALIALCGRSLTIGDRACALFPRPADVAELSEEVLRAHQFSRQKAAYVKAISRAVAEGTLDLEALVALPPDQAIARLTQFHGIGRWTAESVLLRGLGVSSVIPAGDIALRAVIGRAYGFGRTATEAEVRTLAETWGDWRGWATLYWWLASQIHSGVESPF